MHSICCSPPLSAPPGTSALRFDFTHYGFDSCGAADSVAPEQANDLALGNVKIDALQYVALAVEGMKVADFKHCAPRRDRLLEPWGWREYFSVRLLL